MSSSLQAGNSADGVPLRTCNRAPNCARRVSPNPTAYRPVKVEEQRPVRGVERVVRVDQVEDLEDGFDRSAAAEGERPRQLQVPGDELVVAPQRVALQDRAVRADPVRRQAGAARSPAFERSSRRRGTRTDTARCC